LLVRWKGIIRAIIPALLLFSPLIISLIYIANLYVQGYSVTIDSLLGIVILFQTYIIWIQVEIGLRQTAVFQQEFEPSFKPKVSSEMLGDLPYTTVYIENVGEYPAYNVAFGLINKTAKKTFENSMRLHSLAESTMTLAPKDSVALLHMPSSEYKNTEIELNVLYMTMANETRQVTFVKFPKSNDFMLVNAPLNIRQGILLKALEDLRLAYLAVKYFRKKKYDDVK